MTSRPISGSAMTIAQRSGPRQIAAFVGVSLFKDGQMVAAFGANHDAPRAWTAAETELVREVAERTWDAVERTRAEAALREQTTRLTLALEASAGGSWTWDLRTNDADWDDVFRARFGFTPRGTAVIRDVACASARRRSPADASHPGKRFCTPGTPGITHTVSCFLMEPCNGCRAWYAPSATRRARPTRLTGLELDITERRRIEEALQARRDEEHDRTLQTLLETATQGIVSADAGGMLVFANRAVEVMFGWTAERFDRPAHRALDTITRSRRHHPLGRPGPRRQTEGRVPVSDRSHGQSRSRRRAADAPSRS